MRFIKWLGTHSNLINGQVVMYFEFGVLIGLIVGIIIGAILCNIK